MARAWERSAGAGCSPHLARADLLGRQQTDELLQRQRRLLEVATPFMVALSRAAGDERHAAMLSDGEGRLLKIVGDEDTVADESFPHAGALLAEANAGANGIGTALADGHYVELVGPEHFIEGFHVYTCQGVPLASPAGQHSGVISISVRRVEAANKVRDILFCASEAAECELLATWLSDQMMQGKAMPAVLESLRQDMIQRITMARLQLEMAARRIAAGSSAELMIDAARQLGQKFRREAQLWRDLVGEGDPEPQPIALADLAADFVNLMATELRVAAATLTWGRTDRTVVMDDRQALTRRLLDTFLTAIQHATGGGDITLEVRRGERHGEVVLTATTEGGLAGRWQAGGLLHGHGGAGTA